MVATSSWVPSPNRQRSASGTGGVVRGVWDWHGHPTLRACWGHAGTCGPPPCSLDHSGRRRGKATAPADPRSGQAGRPLRWPLPAHRLPALQPGQRRVSQDRRADPVQEPQPRRPHLPDLAAQLVPRQLRHLGAGPDAARARGGSSGRPTPLFQNLNIIDDEGPEYVFVFGADHIYRIDPRQMLDQHIESRAPRSPSPGSGCAKDESEQFGVISRRRRHQDRPRSSEKPHPDEHQRPRRLRPTRSWRRWATTCSAPQALIDLLHDDAMKRRSRHDVGGDLIPAMVVHRDAHVYDFTDQRHPGSARPTRTTGATSERSTATTTPTWTWWATSRPSTSTTTTWPIYTLGRNHPPAKIVNDGDHGASRGRAQPAQQRGHRGRSAGDRIRCSRPGSEVDGRCARSRTRSCSTAW